MPSAERLKPVKHVKFITLLQPLFQLGSRARSWTASSDMVYCSQNRASAGLRKTLLLYPGNIDPGNFPRAIEATVNYFALSPSCSSIVFWS